MRPGTKMAVEYPASFMTRNCGTKEFLNPSSLIGFTIPVVPMIEIPPSIPRVPFKVFLAKVSPAGTETFT